MDRFEKAKVMAEWALRVGISTGNVDADKETDALAVELLHALKSRELWKKAAYCISASDPDKYYNEAEAYDGN